MEETVAQLEPATQEIERPLSILLVDDDEDQVTSLAFRLRRQGFEVLTSLTAAKALAIAEKERPNLVLLDICLPDQSGLEVCSYLADSPQTCGIPIIILSAMDCPDIVRRSRSVGGAYFVRKPYDPNVLLTLIQESLREASDVDW